MKQIDYYICPGCGDEIKVGSKGCPACNRLDPWELEENQIYDGIDLPDDEDNGKRRFHEITLHPVWVATAVVLLIVFFSWMLFGG